MTWHTMVYIAKISNDKTRRPDDQWPDFTKWPPVLNMNINDTYNAFNPVKPSVNVKYLLCQLLEIGQYVRI